MITEELCSEASPPFFPLYNRVKNTYFIDLLWENERLIYTQI